MDRNYSLLAVLLLMVSFILSGCDTDTAPDGSAITVSPSSVTVNTGVAGDSSFLTFVAELTDVNGNQLSGVPVTVKTFFLRIIDQDGNLAESPIDFETNDNGQVVFTLEVPLGTTFIESMTIQSGTTSSEVVNIDVSPFAT